MLALHVSSPSSRWFSSDKLYVVSEVKFDSVRLDSFLKCRRWSTRTYFALVVTFFILLSHQIGREEPSQSQTLVFHSAMSTNSPLAPPSSLPEILQSTILQTLDSDPQGSIDDTRELVYNGVKVGGGGDEQGVVKGVLDSLWSKEVSGWVV